MDGVILDSPAFDRRNAATRAIAERIARISAGWSVAAQQSAAGLSRDVYAVRRFESDKRIYRGQLPAVMAASALRIAHRVHKKAPRWKVPTLVVHGSADRFTPPLAGRAIVDWIRAGDKTFVSIEAGRHDLLTDIESERVMAILLD